MFKTVRPVPCTTTIQVPCTTLAEAELEYTESARVRQWEFCGARGEQQVKGAADGISAYIIFIAQSGGCVTIAHAHTIYG